MMTVSELIDQLLQLPSEAQVWVESYDEPTRADSIDLEVLNEHGYPAGVVQEGRPLLGPANAEGLRRMDVPVVVIR